MALQAATAPKLINISQLRDKIKLGNTAIYERLNPNSKYYDPKFPRPIKLGDGKCPPIAFIESEIDSWIEYRIQQSRLIKV